MSKTQQPASSQKKTQLPKEKLLSKKNTLVKFTIPTLVPNKDEDDPTKKRICDSTDPCEGKVGELQDVLDCILPPRQWEENGAAWRQYVSSDPSTRSDVIKLVEELDSLLVERQARETGICDVRSKLYGQAFDEVIRQVTVNCVERGLLLLRIRDEMRMTITAYHALYQSSISFGLRKALLADAGRDKIMEEYEMLKLAKKKLCQAVDELKLRYELAEKRYAEQKVADEKRHQDEVTFYEKANAQLKDLYLIAQDFSVNFRQPQV